MTNDLSITPAPTGKETRWGLAWLAVDLMVLPTLLAIINSLLPRPLSAGMLNTVYYCLNFGAVLWIFRAFLSTAMKTALKRPFAVIWNAILGYLGYQVLTNLVTNVILMIEPDFGNVNDANIFSMLEQDALPLALSTVFLVPLAEEALYRGLIFRKLMDKNVALAIIVSMLVFAAIHVVGYIGSYSPVLLALCFLQYLPAGYCLCWCYRRTGTIITPILMHTLVNATGIYYAIR